MARVGSTKIAKAFVNRSYERTENTNTDGHNVWLHGNKIMWRENGVVHFSMCGWPTVVTKDRLNHLFDHLNVPLRAYTQNFTPGIYNYITKSKTEISSRLPYSVEDFS